MVIRQTYINGKDTVTIRMYFNSNRIIEKVERVFRLDHFEPGEYILPHTEVTSKQYDRILRSLIK